MTRLVFYALFLALIGRSNALYCLCKDGVSDDELQKALDYACSFGADCGPIQPNGPCYKPNTVKDHCKYAVNSYYQKMQSAGGTCDFAGAATTSSTPPSTASSGCVYPSGPSSGSGSGTTPPSTGTTPGTKPSTPKSPPSSGTRTPCTNVFGSPTCSNNTGDGMIYSGAQLEGTNTKLLYIAPCSYSPMICMVLLVD